MKKRLVQTITEDSVSYGQVSHPLDLMKAQDFVHQRVTDLTRDFLNNVKASEVTGFAYSLGPGNAFDITISTPGRVYAQNGDQFELLANTILDIAEADDEFPRLDLVVAVLEEEVDAELALIPFVRLRTADEFTAGAPPYAPQNTNAPTEKHSRAVIQIKTGIPASVPSPSPTASNEIPLYLIAVAANAAQIRDADVLDIRDTVFTVRKLNDLVGRNAIDIASLLRRVQRVETLVDQPIDLSQVFGQIRTLGDILSSHELQLRGARGFPDIRYQIPKFGLTDKRTSMIPATGNVTTDLSPIPVVDIEIGGIINFGDRDEVVRPDGFADPALNARYHQITENPETTTLISGITLGGVTQTAADGFVDFVEKASEFSAIRSRTACAARDGQSIEVFGGLAGDNATKLSDWATYDVINDTLVPRSPLIALPDSDRPAMMSFGDGTRVLLIAGNSATQDPPCFVIDAETGGVTEILTTRPTGVSFFGDYIAPGKIFVVALRKTLGVAFTDFWEFDTAGSTFTQLGTTGNVPVIDDDQSAAGCFYRENQFVLVKYTPNITSSGETIIFDRPSSQWTKLSIAPPYGDGADKQSPLVRFRMANVNGRPLLVGGLLAKETDPDNARVWELQTFTTQFAAENQQWIAWNGTFPPVQDPGFCSTLANGRPAGLAAIFGGQGKFSNSKRAIFGSIQGGLIATTYKGQPAITVADLGSFATFEVPVYNAPWEVASYLLSFVGEYVDGVNLKVEVSFNDVDYHAVSIDKMLLIGDSDSPGVRRLRVTMYNLKTSKPILAQMQEVFDEDGIDLESRIVIRYDSPATIKALYIHRGGKITLEDEIVPSTSDKALLHKVIPDGMNAPATRSYINRRSAHVKYTGEDGVPIEPGLQDNEFYNELAVPVRYSDARAYSGIDNIMYKLIDTLMPFDQVIPVVGVTGGFWIVEIEG